MISTDTIIDLYREFLSDLKAVRRQQYWFYQRHDNALVRRLRKWRWRRHMLFPALDDLEAEITYLLIRARRPKVIVEMSPNGGWSTTWILSALRDNANGGQLQSYDLHNTSTRLVPRRLSKGRWHFVQGDAKKTMVESPEFNYLFVDSDHSKAFAEWYVENLFPCIRPGTMVSIHDIFYSPEPLEEGAVVLPWLASRGLSYWTAATKVGGDAAARIIDERKRLGIDYPIQ